MTDDGGWDGEEKENVKYSVHYERKNVMVISTGGTRALWKLKKIKMRFGERNLIRLRENIRTLSVIFRFT